MKLRVNEDLCLGCGACRASVQDVFEIGDSGTAYVKVDEVTEDEIKEAA